MAGRNARKLNFATRDTSKASNTSISSTSSTTRQKKGAVVDDRSLLVLTEVLSHYQFTDHVDIVCHNVDIVGSLSKILDGQLFMAVIASIAP